MLNEELKSKLVAMAEHDLRVRAELVASGKLLGGYDEFRASVGLGPLGEKIQEMREHAAAEGHDQTADFDEYLKARKAWARSVGWL